MPRRAVCCSQATPTVASNLRNRRRSCAARCQRSISLQLADAADIFVADAAHVAAAGTPPLQPFHLVGMELCADQSAQAVDCPEIKDRHLDIELRPLAV